MKKLLSLSLASLAFAAVADITVGVTAISTTTKNTIVPVPYSKIGTNAAIAPNELVKAKNLPNGTMLYVFNGESYYAWSQKDGAWVIPDTVSTISGVTVTTSESCTLDKGSALWVVLPEAKSQTIYVYGDGVSPATSSTVAAGNRLVANPLQTAASFTVTGATAGDIITIPSDSGAPTLFRYNGTKWRTFGPGIAPTDASLSMAAGQGFWYSAKGQVTINWTAKNN